MKKIITVLCIATFIFTSCSSDDDRVDNDTVGQTFELENVNFVAPEYAVNIPFPNNVEVFGSDAILVYRLEDIVNGNDVWEPLPTPVIFLENNGELNYRFNHTVNDVDIYLETPDISLIGDNYRINQVFRIVVVPSGFATNTNIDLSDFNAVQDAIELEYK